MNKPGTIGVVGGMGPRAGLDLIRSIMDHTDAASDQEHLPAILMSLPASLADRTDFLEGRTAVNPAYAIARIIVKLEEAGAGIIGIACNTSHVPRIYDVVLEELGQAGSKVRLINMPLETCLRIKIEYPQYRRIGLMATTGTFRSGLYPDLLREMGYEVILPDQRLQASVIHRMVYDPVFGIKSTREVSAKIWPLMDRALAYFRKEAADVVILGCTELSSLQAWCNTHGMPVIDSTEALARALIREARAPLTRPVIR